MRYCLNYSGKGFLPLKIEITPFPDGFHLKKTFMCTLATLQTGSCFIYQFLRVHSRDYVKLAPSPLPSPPPLHRVYFTIF